jgi:hypothetical protein
MDMEGNTLYQIAALISLRGLDICWENTITEIQGFFIYCAVGVPGIINDNLID